MIFLFKIVYRLTGIPPLSPRTFHLTDGKLISREELQIEVGSRYKHLMDFSEESEAPWLFTHQ